MVSGSSWFDENGIRKVPDSMEWTEIKSRIFRISSYRILSIIIGDTLEWGGVRGVAASWWTGFRQSAVILK